MKTISLTLIEARRLAVAAQCLAGPRLPATKEGILAVLRQLNCLQIDPIRAVERTQRLVLWSRLGPFDVSLLDTLQEERHIIEAWAHCASFILTEDYPLFHPWIRRAYTGSSEWARRVRTWMEANTALREHIVEQLRAHGPLPSKAFEDRAVVPWHSKGWTGGRNVSRMLDFLDSSGVVMSVGRRGNQKLWHLRDEWLPEWADRVPVSQAEAVRAACQRSLKALGVATQKQINNHFIRNTYPNLGARLAELMADGRVLPAQIHEEGKLWPGDWYIHRHSLPLLESIRAGGWQPRTVFLSPFDNLICDRGRTELLFDFHYRIEIYVPKTKRHYGYYVLPLLHGDRFIGRMDSRLDRKAGVYHIHALYPEVEGVSVQSGAALAQSLLGLARFIGARSIELGEQIPSLWRMELTSILD